MVANWKRNSHILIIQRYVTLSARPNHQKTNEYRSDILFSVFNHSNLKLNLPFLISYSVNYWTFLYGYGVRGPITASKLGDCHVLMLVACGWSRVSSPCFPHRQGLHSSKMLRGPLLKTVLDRQNYWLTCSHMLLRSYVSMNTYTPSLIKLIILIMLPMRSIF